MDREWAAIIGPRTKDGLGELLSFLAVICGFLGLGAIQFGFHFFVQVQDAIARRPQPGHGAGRAGALAIFLILVGAVLVLTAVVLLGVGFVLHRHLSVQWVFDRIGNDHWLLRIGGVLALIVPVVISVAGTRVFAGNRFLLLAFLGLGSYFVGSVFVLAAVE